MIASIGSRIAAVVALGASLVLGASGCSQSEPGEATCTGPDIGTTFKIVETGKTVGATCMSFSVGGVPKSDPDYKHIAELHFEGGAILSLFFPNATPAGTTLTFGGSAADFGVDLIDYNGFEGGSRSLCRTRPSSPNDAALAGSVTFDEVTMGADGFLTALHGSIEARFEGCTVEGFGVTNQILTLKGDF